METCQDALMKSLEVLGFQKIGIMAKKVVLSAMLVVMKVRMLKTYLCVAHYLLGGELGLSSGVSRSGFDYLFPSRFEFSGQRLGVGLSYFFMNLSVRRKDWGAGTNCGGLSLFQLSNSFQHVILRHRH